MTSIPAAEDPSPARHIPFTKPAIGAVEMRAVGSALRNLRVGGNGAICKRVQEALAQMVGARHALLTPNATQAMELGLLAMGIGAGDEVLMPSFAFVSQANAILQRGAVPVFCEIDPACMNLDVADAARRITPRTRLIMPVHYAGVACDMEAIRKLAAERGLLVFEDAAQGLGSYWNGQHVGALGNAGCISFHETKNITCGEGGLFVTNDENLARKAEVIQEKGTNRSAFLRGEVDRYTWISQGGSYVLSEVLAALLEAQLTRLPVLQKQRQGLWLTYYQGLADLEQKGYLRRPAIPAWARHNAHIFWFRTSQPEQQRKLLAHLRSAGIQATFHFQPLHASPYARGVLKLDVRLPVTEREADCLVRLPLNAHLKKKDAQWVVDETRKALLG